MFESVLIANRGEIARRIERTCDRLGIRTVVMEGSFMDIDAVIAAGAGCDAVHPGYGFLSESPTLARACAAAGLVWIGPSPEAIEAVGDKVRARELAVSVGVPVVPEGTEGGYPVMVKAAAGGGGRGMRVVRSEAELEDAIAAARREAAAGFGDDRVFIERYVPRARHVEVQMLGDVALGERECSLQRRHQKVIEEAPALIPDELRTELLREASAVARAAGYENAGTVEFILNADDLSEHYFLEMNARLQVEHPVTEMVTGLDLVEAQLRIASGEEWSWDGAVSGHAIEARVTAENAEWLPQTGTVLRYAEGPGVRVDSGIEEGFEVTGRYDSLLAKVIAHGADRDEAVARLDRALRETTVLGVHTSIPNLRRLLTIPPSEFHTERVASLPPEGRSSDTAAVARAAAAVEFAELGAGDGWRLGGERAPSWWLLQVEDAEPETVVLPAGEAPPPGWSHAREPDGTLWLGRDGQAWRVREPSIEETLRPTAGGEVRAPMPGSVLTVDVAEGDAVEEGDRLIVLESMKMELSLTAPKDGTVTSLGVGQGDRVKQGESLVTIA